MGLWRRRDWEGREKTVYAQWVFCFILGCLHFLWLSPHHHSFTPVAAMSSHSSSSIQLEVFPVLAKVAHDGPSMTPAGLSRLLGDPSFRSAGPLSQLLIIPKLSFCSLNPKDCSSLLQLLSLLQCSLLFLPFWLPGKKLYCYLTISLWTGMVSMSQLSPGWSIAKDKGKDLWLFKFGCFEYAQ